MTDLSFRTPGTPRALRDLLQRAAPGAGLEGAADALRAGGIRIGDRAARSLDEIVPPGVAVAAIGLAPGAFPAIRPDRPLDAIALAPPWDRGRLEADGGAIGFEVRERRGGLARMRIDPHTGPESAARGLAAAGFPVLADVWHGGVLVGGGLRLWFEEADRRDGRWPDEPVFVDAVDGEPPAFHVSRATARALSRGHPWILSDDECADAAAFRPGTLVRVSDRPDRIAGLAHVEGPGRVAAGVWAKGVERARDSASIEARIAQAIARRRSLLGRATECDAVRLVHGESDGLPGLAIDRLGPLLRVLVTGRSVEGFLDRAVAAVVSQLAATLGADPPVVRVLHLRERPPGRLECVRSIGGPLASDPVERPGAWRGEWLRVLDRGLAFWVDPGIGEPERSSPGIGLYLDQRDNRSRLARLAARGGRWLNLFAHTGAFSVALLAGGADEVVSVDLSGPYLRWLDENLALNRERGVDPGRHRSVRHDGRRYLSGLAADERFAGIVIDPPTAAAAGRRFWSVARDLSPLLEAACSRLDSGGTLFVSRNDRRGGSIGALVEEAAQRTGVSLSGIESAAPAEDFPRLKGFPEGDAFHAVLVRRK